MFARGAAERWRCLFNSQALTAQPPAPEDPLLSNSVKWGYSCSPPRLHTARTLLPRMSTRNKSDQLRKGDTVPVFDTKHLSFLRPLGIDLETGSLKLAGDTETVHKHGILQHSLLPLPPQTLSAHRTDTAPGVTQESHAMNGFPWDDAWLRKSDTWTHVDLVYHQLT